MKKLQPCPPAPSEAYTPVPGDFDLLEQADITTDTNFASQGYWKGVATHFVRNKRAMIGLVIVALLLTEWIGMSKIARAEMLKIKEQEYVLASRTLGARSSHIIFKEILPNTIGPIITQVMFSIPTAIFTEAFLSFVGVGIVLPQCSIGTLIEDGFNTITTLPYQILPPILVLALLMLGFNFIGDGLREALAPKLEDM